VVQDWSNFHQLNTVGAAWKVTLPGATLEAAASGTFYRKS
jgi:hypothetical protein